MNKSNLFPPVVWFIWDGAAAWAARRLRAEGKLPALQRIAERGVEGEAQPPSPNCQTPPSLATLFTGTWPHKHGIHGFDVPVSWLTYRKGFEREALRMQPIWEYAANSGLESVLVHIPWVMPDEGNDLIKPIRYAIEGYSKRVTRGGAFVIEPEKTGEVLDYKRGPVSLKLRREPDGSVSVWNREREDALVLKPAAAGDHAAPLQQSIQLGEDRVHLQLFCRSDGAYVVAHPGIWRPRCGGGEEGEQDSCGSVAPFVGEGLGRAYREGLFGKKLAEGGTGEAEQLLLHTIGWSAEYFNRSALEAVDRVKDAQLYLFYQPCIDDVEHELMGLCDPASKAYRPDIAAKVWEVVGEVYQWADQGLAMIRERLGDSCTYIVSSDHGMAGMTHTVYVNELLEQAGLLAFNEFGEPDASRTSIVFHPANNGSLWLNPDIRDSEKRQQVLERTTELLRQAADTAIEGKLFEAIYPLEGIPSGYSPQMGELFVAAADGLELSAGRSEDGRILVPASKTASHATNPRRPSLRGIFYAEGTGIPTGTSLGAVDNRSVFPLVCRQLGVTSPDTIEGKAAFEPVQNIQAVR